jgi:FKBP-type peptidyl-prolyl cis-trans isomerase 2
VAYGEVNAAATTEIPREAFPEGLELEAGMPVPLASPDGHRLVGTVSQLNESVVTVDLNHPLAGQELKFDIELVEIEDPSV